MQNLKAPTHLWARWLNEVSSYDFDVIHRPGTQHTNADGLSHAEHLPEHDQDEEGIYAHADQQDEFNHMEVAEHNKDLTADEKEVRGVTYMPPALTG